MFVDVDVEECNLEPATTQKLKPAKYPSFSLDEERKGEIIDLVHESGRDVPLSKVRFEDGSDFIYPSTFRN